MGNQLVIWKIDNHVAVTILVYVDDAMRSRGADLRDVMAATYDDAARLLREDIEILANVLYSLCAACVVERDLCQSGTNLCNWYVRLVRYTMITMFKKLSMFLMQISTAASCPQSKTFPAA